MLTASLTATATHPAGVPWPALLGLLLILTAGYWLTAMIWPYRTCPRCHGTGKLYSPTGKTWRHCPRCTGTGARPRPLTRTRTRHHD